mgnify:CR=1 FL=1
MITVSLVQNLQWIKGAYGPDGTACGQNAQLTLLQRQLIKNVILLFCFQNKIPGIIYKDNTAYKLNIFDILGDPEVTANLYCNFAYPYWEG